MRTLENTIRDVVLGEANKSMGKAHADLVGISDKKHVEHHMSNVAHKVAQQAEKEKSYDMKAMHYKDAASYMKIAEHLAKAEPLHARTVFNNMDTAARDYAITHTPKHAHKHIADVLNFDLN